MSTNEKVVDVLTKPLSQVNFEYFFDKLGVVRKDFPCKEEQWWYYKIFLQEGMMKIWTLFRKEEQVKYMESPWKQRTCQTYEPSSDKGGAGWLYASSLERGSDDKTVIDDGMPLKLQYKRGQVHLNMMTRSDIHLWMTIYPLEDGLIENNTMFLRVVLTS